MKFRAFLSDNSEIVFYMAGILTLDSLSSMLANNNNRFILLDNIENNYMGNRKKLVNISYIVSIIETV